MKFKLFFMKKLNNILRKTHKKQFELEWCQPKKAPPEWFDHYLDLYYQWPTKNESLFLERGIFNLLAIKNNGNILELCCGDGFNAKFFYSKMANKIISVDFDKSAIEHAKLYNSVSNIEYKLCDIRHDLPEGSFDNIIWDGAIEHFTEDEIVQIMNNLKSRLTKDGVLCGHTIVESVNGKSLPQHEYEFKSKEDLLRFLDPYFKNVRVFETVYPERHNLYFWASDSIIPFDKNWKHQVTRSSNQEQQISYPQ